MEVANWYSVAKALHLIGMVSWMAGLFYLVRIMVYHAEADNRPEPARAILVAQYTVMEWKVYRVIIRPATVITWMFGLLMLLLQPVWLQQAWIYAKLTFVLLLTGYTYYCQVHIRRLELHVSGFTHLHYRVMNEIPTIILAAVVFLAVFRTRINWLYLFCGIGLFAGLIFSAVRKVAAKMKKNASEV